MFREKASKIRGNIGSQIHIKIELWALMGFIFDFVGSDLRGLISFEFLIGKHINEQLKVRDVDAKETLHSYRVSGMDGVQQRLLKSARSAKTIRNASRPCRQGRRM